MLEKRLYAVSPQLFTADGTTRGVITIAADACSLFKVKQKVVISATGLPNLELEIKEIDGTNNIQVGPIPTGKPGQNTSIDARTDISAYTVALGAFIYANKQKRQDIGPDETARAVYEEEPTVAVRNILVDECGDRINKTNPLPVSNGLIPAVWDEVDLVRDCDGDILEASFFMCGSLLTTVQLTYDCHKNLIKVKGTCV